MTFNPDVTTVKVFLPMSGNPNPSVLFPSLPPFPPFFFPTVAIVIIPMSNDHKKWGVSEMSRFMGRSRLGTEGDGSNGKHTEQRNRD
jgi:hypothetical protein